MVTVSHVNKPEQLKTQFTLCNCDQINIFLSSPKPNQPILKVAGDDQGCQQPMTELREDPLLRKENGHGKRVLE